MYSPGAGILESGILESGILESGILESGILEFGILESPAKKLERRMHSPVLGILESGILESVCQSLKVVKNATNTLVFACQGSEKLYI